MYVCMFVCMYVCMHAGMHAYIYIYTYSVYLCRYRYVAISYFIHAYIYIHISLYILFTYTYTCIDECVYVCISIYDRCICHLYLCSTKISILDNLDLKISFLFDPEHSHCSCSCAGKACTRPVPTPCLQTKENYKRLPVTDAAIHSVGPNLH